MRSAATSLIAMALALVLGAAVLRLLGAPPLEAYRGMLASCGRSLGDTVAKTTILILLGSAVAVAFRSGFWNVGAEGQLCVGAVAAAGVGLFLAPQDPGATAVLWQGAILTSGAAAGALWCVLPAFLKARWQVSEVVTTLMLVYVGRRMMEYLYLGPWKDPRGFGFPGTASLPEGLLVPTVWLLAAACLAAALCGLLVSRTPLGFEMAVLGESREVARYAGIRGSRCLGAAAIVSGGLAGLAGAAQVVSTAGRLISGISVGDGFTAIIVACLAGRQPLAVVLAAPLWALLKVGAQDLELTYRVPQAFSTALEGLCLLCWLAAAGSPDARVADWKLRVMGDWAWGELALAVWLAAAAYAGPMVLAAIGETLAERSGVLNLGLEGVLAAGALVGYGVSAQSGSAWLGLVAGTAAGLLLGAVHATLVVDLGSDQIIAGLGLTLAATGGAAFLGPLWIARLGAPALLPELSADRMKLLLAYAPTTYLGLFAAFGAAWLLSRWRLGLVIRAAGDSPEAAQALGISVRAVRWRCVCAGAALGGLAGATLSLAYARTWTSTLPNGMGWMVIALVPLSAWKPLRVLAFCLLLAAVSAAQMQFQILGVRISSSLLDMLPYLTTLVAVVLGRIVPGARLFPAEPAALGRPLGPG